MDEMQSEIAKSIKDMHELADFIDDHEIGMGDVADGYKCRKAALIMSTLLEFITNITTNVAHQTSKCERRLK